MTMTKRLLAFAGALLFAGTLGLVSAMTPSFAYADQNMPDYSSQDIEHQETEENSASTQYYMDGSALKNEITAVIPLPDSSQDELKDDISNGPFPKTGDDAPLSLLASIGLIALGTMLLAAGMKGLRKREAPDKAPTEYFLADE